MSLSANALPTHTQDAHQPYLISWNVTRRCNLNCAHCYMDAGARSTPSDDELTTEEGRRLLDDIADVGPGAMLVLTGGEPLLRPDIFDLAEHAAQRGLLVVLGTNAYLLTDDAAQKLADAGVRGVGISLDSAHASRHDDFRDRPGSWRSALEAMDVCRRRGLEFQVQMSVTTHTVDEVPSVLDLARDRGAKAFNVFFLVCTGRGQGITDISPQQYEQTLSSLVELGGSHGGMMVRARCAPYVARIARQSNPGLSLYEDQVACIAATYYCRITPEGAVTPCPYLPVAAGAIRKQSFGEIWRGSELLTEMRSGDLGGKCGACEYGATCGGCRARAFAMTGDYMAEDSWCLHQPTQASHGVGDDREPAREPVWTEEARDRFARAPGFVRKMVMRKIEQYALEHDHHLITADVVDGAKGGMRVPRMSPEGGLSHSSSPRDRATSFGRQQARRPREARQGEDG